MSDTMNIAEADLSYASFTESDLFAGERQIWTEPDTIAEAVAEVAQYTVLGRVAAADIDESTIAVGAPAFTGTGNGVLTKATPAFGTGVQIGTYSVNLVEVTTDAGKFEVIRPDGTSDGFAVVGVAYDGQVKFTIADGATDFSGAAKFTLAVTADGDAAAGKLVKCVRTATDGSQVPVAIAAYAVDATEGDVTAAVYKGGKFNIAKVVWDASWTTDAQKIAAAPDGANLSFGKLGYSGG